MDTDTGIYSYSYSVSNPSSNSGDILTIEVDISKPVNSAELSSKGLSIQMGQNINGQMIVKSFDQKLSEIANMLITPVIPVGARPPFGLPFPGWDVDISVNGTVMWGGSDQNLILPNQTLDGFQLTSYGLPTIRNITVRPLLDDTANYYPQWKDVEGANDPSAAIMNAIDELEASTSYQGKTVGPTAPPAQLVPADFLSYIGSLIDQSSSLGWISDNGILQSLKVKLYNAQKDISKGDLQSAKGILGAFINEVEAQGCPSYNNCPSGKHLTPEAYALLIFNAQYLLNNLN